MSRSVACSLSHLHPQEAKFSLSRYLQLSWCVRLLQSSKQCKGCLSRITEGSMECLRNLPTRNPASFTSSSSSEDYSLMQKIEQPPLLISTQHNSECQSHPVIRTESTSILVREFKRMQEAKERQSTAGKRQIEQPHQRERQRKHPRRHCLFAGNYRDLQEGATQSLA